MTALTLVRNETIKTTRRPAFLVAVLGFAALVAIVMLEQQSGDEPLAFPAIWAELTSDIGVVAPFFAAILVVLLVTSEFSFRTARQNVIDGLSKNAWFAGKLLLVPAIAGVFTTLLFAIGAVAALRVGVDGAIVRAADAAVIGGYTLGVVLLVAGAFMLAVLIRGSGAAMAVFFFYLTLLENLITLTVGRFRPDARPALEFLPFAVFRKLVAPEHFDPAIVADAAARAADAGKPFEAPTLVDPGVLVLSGSAWILAFIAVAYVVFRKRDL